MKIHVFLWLFCGILSMNLWAEKAVSGDSVNVLVSPRSFNPIVPDNIADPSISKFGDTYYLFATTDIDKGLYMAGMPVVWTSKDFVNWSFEGSHISGIDWRKPYAYTNEKGEQRQAYFRYWAPGKVIQYKGEYLLYVTFVKPEGSNCTYLLTSNNPQGPYRFADGKGLYPPQEADKDSKPVAPDIDGDPFLDDDGSLYLFWRCRMAAQLTADGRNIQEGTQIELQTKRGGYSEGPTMFKRKGIYYYIYTLRGDQNYANAYMVSKEGPLTGFEAPAGKDIFIYSSLENNVWGPGHGNVFYDSDRDEYFFCYLEYGEGSTTRQVYVNRMNFNEDGSIQTIVPDTYGVGYLAKNQEKRKNLSLEASFVASSEKVDRIVKGNIETQPNQPLPNRASQQDVTRCFHYFAANVADLSNGTRWMAAPDDAQPWLMADLHTVRKISEVQMAFTQPTEGHTWRLEKSMDAKTWQLCAEQNETVARSPHKALHIGKARYLRVTITSGSAGLWEIKIF